MIWVLLVIGILLLLPLFFKTLAWGIRIIFAILGPLLIIAFIILLILGIIFNPLALILLLGLKNQCSK